MRTLTLLLLTADEPARLAENQTVVATHLISDTRVALVVATDDDAEPGPAPVL